MVPAGSSTATSTPTDRKMDCCQYAMSTARRLLTRPPPQTKRRVGEAPALRRWGPQRERSEPRPARRNGARRSRASDDETSSIDVPEDEVEAGEDRDDVGDEHAAEDPRQHRHVVEAGRADLQPERPEVALRDHVVAHGAERVL